MPLTFIEISTPLQNIAQQLGLIAQSQTSGLVLVSPPAHSNSVGTPNQVAYDGSFWYVCISTNTWARVAIGGSW